MKEQSEQLNETDMTILKGFLGPHYVDYFWYPWETREELAQRIQKQIAKIERSEERLE